MRPLLFAAFVGCALCSVGIAGCGASGSPPQATMSFQSAPSPAAKVAADRSTEAPSALANRTEERNVTATPRRVIYSADLAMQTRDFTKAERAIPALVKQLGGYVTDISLNRQQGEQRSGRWQARIPAESFHDFLEGLDDVGIPERRQITGQDVTEEYVDLEARLANKKRLEERLLELMKSKSTSVADVIEFERQVAQVREEIERMEGRVRYLTNRSDLSTVTLSIREVQEYVPPQEPTFATKLTETWSGTTGTFRHWGEETVLNGLRALPGLSVLVVVGLLALFARRIAKRLMSSRQLV